LSVSPAEVEVLLVLADALARQEQFAEAVMQLQESPDIHVALARALAAQGKGDEAEKHYQEALRLLKSPKQIQSPP